MAAAMTGGSCIFVLYRKDCCCARDRRRVYTHCMRRIAALVLLCVFGALLPSATVLALAAPQQLLPICCRAHGAHSCVMGAWPMQSSDAGPALRQPACPFGQSLRAITTVTITADFASRTSFGLAVADIDRQLIADAVATRMLRRSAPRGPPSSLRLALSHPPMPGTPYLARFSRGFHKSQPLNFQGRRELGSGGRGIPHLAKNERSDMGHPWLVGGTEFKVGLACATTEKEMPVRYLYRFVLMVVAIVCLPVAQATVLMAVRGVVHDPNHRPIAGATVTLHAADSDFVENEKTNTNGEFSFSAVPLGVYIITAAQSGFSTAARDHYRGFQYFAGFAL